MSEHEQDDSPSTAGPLDPQPPRAPDARFPPRVEYERKLPRCTQAQLTCIEDELGRKHYTAPNGRRVCGRLRKRASAKIENEACMCPPCANGACRMHGGASTGRHFKSGGRYSRVLRKWRRPFQRAMDDKDLLDLRADVAMMDTVVERLTARAEHHDAPSWRNELLAIYGDLDRAVKEMDHAGVARLLKELGERIRQGAKADQVRRDLLFEVERRARTAAKMSELELKRETKLTEAEVAAAFGAFVGVLQQRLDVEVLRTLIPELRKVLPAPRLLQASVVGSGMPMGSDDDTEEAE